MDLPQAKCPHCGALNPDDAFFCSECGGQTRSLVTDARGPVSDVDGDFEIKPIFPAPPAAPAGEPVAPPAPPAVPAPYQPAPYQPAPYQPAPYQPPVREPQAPGAGLASPPPPPQPQQPAQPPPPPQPAPYGGYTAPDQQPYGAVSGPPPGAPVDASTYYGQPGGYPTAPAYGYAMPPDGNTSGMGSGYPVPPDASGWTFAGCVPWGLFGFFNGSTLWGIVCLAGMFVPIAGLVYMIYIGIQGKELAWRGRRFNSLLEYQDTMSAWNRWGVICAIISAFLIVVGVIAYVALIFWAISEGNA